MAQLATSQLYIPQALWWGSQALNLVNGNGKSWCELQSFISLGRYFENKILSGLLLISSESLAGISGSIQHCQTCGAHGTMTYIDQRWELRVYEPDFSPLNQEEFKKQF